MATKRHKKAQEEKNKVFKTYEEASFFFNEGDFEQALARFNQVISEGGDGDDDMVLKVVNAALRQREKCQYRLLRM